MEKIGKAACLTTHRFRTMRFGCEIVAGVVRVGNENKIIALRTSGARVGKMVRPTMRPKELDTNPAFNTWPMASYEEAKKIYSGEIPTSYSGTSLGAVIVRYFQLATPTQNQAV